MSNIFGLISEQTFAEKMDTQNRFLAALVTAQGGNFKPQSYAEIQSLVRDGLHQRVFSIGDQLVCSKGSKTLTWDIIGIDHDTPADPQFKHSLTLQLHDCFDSLQFDGTEALYYCETELAAGTYNFTLLSGYDTGYGGGKTYQFTLTQPVPAGGQIMFPWGYQVQAASTKVSTYASRTSTSAIESVSVTEGTAGTSLGTADGKTANMNHTHRIRYGSNNWAESAVRQWLNSSAAAGSVWTPKTIFDRLPTWAASTAGFMSDIDPEFLAVIGKTKKVTCRNTVTDGGGFDVTEDKFFLLSRSEIFAGNEVSGVNEGDPYPYYANYSDYTSPNANADSNRIKYKNGSPTWWWLRSPGAGVGDNVRVVDATGYLNYHYAFNSGGVAPACNVI